MRASTDRTSMEREAETRGEVLSPWVRSGGIASGQLHPSLTNRTRPGRGSPRRHDGSEAPRRPCHAGETAGAPEGPPLPKRHPNPAVRQVCAHWQRRPSAPATDRAVCKFWCKVGFVRYRQRTTVRRRSSRVGGPAPAHLSGSPFLVAMPVAVRLAVTRPIPGAHGNASGRPSAGPGGGRAAPGMPLGKSDRQYPAAIGIP